MNAGTAADRKAVTVRAGRAADAFALYAPRGAGLGSRMDHLTRSARRDGFERVCAFAHDPAFFVGLGFSIAPHARVPEKIAHDCAACRLFRSCGQFALVQDLREAGFRSPAASDVDLRIESHAH